MQPPPFDPLAPEGLEALASEAGIRLPRPVFDLLSRHAREMLRWNRAVRLTALTDPLAVAVKHVVDSLVLLGFGPFPGRTLDLGSGAGYPGIPLAACAPESRVVLLEARKKKAAFLSHARALLGLSNVEVVAARLEARRVPPGGPFDHAVSRAAGPPGAVVRLLRPCLAPGGRILLLTGPLPGGAPREARSGAEGGEGACRAAPGALPGPPPEPWPGALSDRVVGYELPRGMGRRAVREIRFP